MLATEQRKRLSKILAEEKGVVDGRITSMGVVIRFTPPVPNIPADTVLVKENMEGQAVAHLETYGSKFKKEFVVAGLLFAVQDSIEKRFFAYPIERTPEGEAALLWSSQRQSSGKLPKGTDWNVDDPEERKLSRVC